MYTVAVRNLGKISYKSALSLQMELVTKYSNRETTNENSVGELLLCQHDPPVYTFGLREKETKEREKRLIALGADVMKIRRGGLTTVHSPGQLVCYPILNLHKIKLGVRCYVKGLEQSIIKTCSHFGLTANTTDDIGVWIGGAKVCAIGIQVSKGVTYHGLALNCCNDLSWFDHIIPCGLEGKDVTSLTKLLERKIPVEEVSPVLVHSLTKQFNLSL